MNVVGPDVFVAPLVRGRLLYHFQTVLHLLWCGRLLAVEFDGESREVPNHNIENLVDQVGFQFLEPGFLQHKLSIHDQGEDFPQAHQEIYVFFLLVIRSGRRQKLLEDLNLLLEDVDVGDVESVEDMSLIVKLNPAQAAGRALVEQEFV